MADNSGHRSEKTIDSPREHEEYPGQTLVTHTKDGNDSNFFHLVNPSND